MEEEDKECLKLHGYVFSSDDEYELDVSKFELDQRYEALKPPPIIIDPKIHKIIQIDSSHTESSLKKKKPQRLTTTNNKKTLSSVTIDKKGKVDRLKRCALKKAEDTAADGIAKIENNFFFPLSDEWDIAPVTADTERRHLLNNSEENQKKNISAEYCFEEEINLEGNNSENQNSLCSGNVMKKVLNENCAIQINPINTSNTSDGIKPTDMLHQNTVKKMSKTKKRRLKRKLLKLSVVDGPVNVECNEMTDKDQMNRSNCDVVIKHKNLLLIDTADSNENVKNDKPQRRKRNRKKTYISDNSCVYEGDCNDRLNQSENKNSKKAAKPCEKETSSSHLNTTKDLPQIHNFSSHSPFVALNLKRSQAHLNQFSILTEDIMVNLECLYDDSSYNEIFFDDCECWNYPNFYLWEDTRSIFSTDRNNLENNLDFEEFLVLSNEQNIIRMGDFHVEGVNDFSDLKRSILVWTTTQILSSFWDFVVNECL